MLNNSGLSIERFLCLRSICLKSVYLKNQDSEKGMDDFDFADNLKNITITIKKKGLS